MKTEEIIVALRHCAVNHTACKGCPAYNQDSGCLDRLHAQAADALEVALADLKKADMGCNFCANSRKDAPCDAADCDCSICTEDCICKTCRDNSNWSWCGADMRGNEDGK